MPFPVVVVNAFGTTLSGDTLLRATPEDMIENRPLNRRFYNFNMIITKPFPFNDQTRLVLSDNNEVDSYLLIDRLGNPVIAEQLQPFASNRRCISSQFDSVTKTVRVCSNICPTDKYINQWLSAAVTEPEAPSDTSK